MTENRLPHPVFVVGAGRSGTTIVLHAVAKVDGVAAVPRLAGRIPSLSPVAATMMRKGVGPEGWTRPSGESSRLLAEAGLTPDFQTSLDGRSVRASDGGRLNMDAFVKRLSQIRHWSGARTVVVKNTASCANIPILAATFPRAVFLHVVRDPREVVSSLLRTSFWWQMPLRWDGRTTQEYARDEGISHEWVAARHWARQVGAANDDLRDLPDSRWRQIDYGRFAQRPADLWQLIHELHVSVEPQEQYMAKLENLRIRPRGRTLEFSRSIEHAVARECSELVREIGL